MEFVKESSHTRIICDADSKKTTQLGTSMKACSPITLKWLMIAMRPNCNNYKIGTHILSDMFRFCKTIIRGFKFT